MTSWAARATSWLHGAGPVIRDSALEFQEDRARRLSAGLSYYSLFALVPLLFLAVAIAGIFVGREAAEGEVVDSIEEVVGRDAARQIERALAATWESTNTSGVAIISAGVLLFSASVLFVAWKDTLEAVWDVPYVPSIKESLRARLMGVLAPIGVGLLLGFVLVVEIVMGFVEQLVDSSVLDASLRAVGSIVPAVVAVLALGLLYRYTPRAQRPAWADVWPGTIFVSIVLAIGMWLYGLYVGTIGSASVAGAASSVLVGLLVIYYATQTVLFGAEIIKVLGRRRQLA